jgi:sulfopyruvate decarboxylase subunit beta
MKRFDCMTALAAKLKEELVVLSLGASVDEWYNAAPHMRAASLFQQQLGCVTPQAFGLAVGLPHRRIISLDTDGGILFNLGILATLGNEQPKNLLVVVWDNECYQSIGGPPTHTASGRVDIARIALGAGIEHAYLTRTLGEFEQRCEEGLQARSPYVIVAKIDGEVRRGMRRKHSDGREDKYIFVRHIEATENIVIMGPSEHN